MIPRSSFLSTVLSAAFLCGIVRSACAVDAASFEFAGADKVQSARFAAQWNWQSQWRPLNGTKLVGYWDLSLAEWRGTRFRNTPGRHQYLTDLGITPVLRLSGETGTGSYFEAGVGAHLLSEKYNNNGHRFSTNFQFGTHVGVGYVFQNRLDLGINFRHLSNAGIMQPNSGQNFAGARIAYTF